MEGVLGRAAAAGATQESELVERASAGDRIAFDRLLDRHLEPSFRTAMAILGHEADARDVTQEVFVKAWRQLPRLRDPERFAAWLGRIVVNSCRSALRGRRRMIVREIPAASIDEAASRHPAGGEFTERTANRDLLERAFGRLDAEGRTILVLHHYDERPIGEIALLLGIPEGTAKSRLHAARRALERALEAERR